MAKEVKKPKVSKPKVEKEKEVLEVTEEQVQTVEEMGMDKLPNDVDVFTKEEVIEPNDIDKKPEENGKDMSNQKPKPIPENSENKVPSHERDNSEVTKVDVMSEQPILGYNMMPTEFVILPTIEENLEVGSCYLVKVNKFLSNRLSKYSVRLVTNDGYKELMRTGREKAFLVANDVNKHNNHKGELLILE